jgi:hypothetical protein
MLCKFGIDWIEALPVGAKMLNLADVLVVGYELFEEYANVLRNDGVELLHVFRRYLLIVFDDSIEMVTSNSNFIEDQIKE